QACRQARPEIGAHLLNLGQLQVSERKVLGPVLAQQLCAVLEATGQLSTKGLDDTPLGPILDAQPTNFVRVATVRKTAAGTEEAWLRRPLAPSSGQQHWLITRGTVSMIEAWYETLVKQSLTTRPTVESLNAGIGALPAEVQAESPRAA